MKILITTEFYLPFQCGVTTAVINEKKSLSELGHDIRILTIWDGKESKYEDGVYYIRSNIPQLYKDSYATFAFNDKMLKDIYEWHPDIVHSNCEFFTNIFAKKIAKKLNISLINTSHTDFNAYQVHFTKNDGLWRFLTTKFIPKLLKDSDYILSASPKNYDLLKSYGIKNKMKVVPCGLDLDKFDHVLTDEERQEIRKQYKIKTDETVLVSVCRLSEEKNVKETLINFSKLLEAKSDIKLLVVGDGTEKANLEKQSEELQIQDNVVFTGNVPMEDVWKYYKTGDIFVSSSQSEIQGLTYIEALACGIPILCRRDAALDISLEEGKNGFGYSSQTEFIDKALQLINNKEQRKNMGKYAKESADKFSLTNFANQLLSVFEEAIRSKAES